MEISIYILRLLSTKFIREYMARFIPKKAQWYKRRSQIYGTFRVSLFKINFVNATRTYTRMLTLILRNV